MKKTMALLSGALLVFIVFQAQPAFAGAGCCPKGAKVDKAACGTHAEGAMNMNCTVDGKTVACTKGADGTCTLPAGTADAAAIKAGTKTVMVGDKSVTAKVNADGSMTMACAPGSCHMDAATCGSHDKSASKSKKKAKAMDMSTETKKSGI